MRITLRGLVVSVLAVVSLIVSLYTGSTLLLAVSVSLLLVVAWSREYAKRVSGSLEEVVIERSIERSRVGEGGEVAVRVYIHNNSGTRIPLFILRDHVSPGLEVVRGSERLWASVPPRSSIENTYIVRGSRPGRHDIDYVYIAVGDPLGLFLEERVLRLYSYITVVPSSTKTGLVEKVRSLYPGAVLRGRSLGGLYDLWGFRDYVPGDDVRKIYWKGLARTGRLLVREDIGESRARALLILGLTRLSWAVGEGPNTYAETVLRMYRSLAEALLDTYSVVDTLVCEGEVVKVFRDITLSTRERLYSVFDEISFRGGCGTIGIALVNLYRVDLSRYQLVVVALSPVDMVSTDPVSLTEYIKRSGLRAVFVVPHRDYTRDLGPGLLESLSSLLGRLGSPLVVAEESFERL